MRWLALLILFDLQNVVARFRRPILCHPWLPRSADFTILVPIYGDPRYLANLDFLRAYQENVLIAVNVDSERMEAFAWSLESSGWRVHRAQCRSTPTGVPEICLSALKGGQITTTYVVRLDGDSYFADDVGRAITAVAREDADLCSVKIRVAEPRRLVEQMQSVEYDISMLSRHYRPWLTSGACMIGKTTVLRHILTHHSRWFPGEDLETGRVGKYFRFRIHHCDCVVYTCAPRTWRQWFRQRRSWWSGNFRDTFQNLDINLRYTIWVLYYLGLVWVLLSGKIVSVVLEYRYIPLLIVAYTAVTYLANWQVRSRWMILFPYYALAQVLVMPVMGALYYLRLCAKSRRSGRYRITRRTRPVPATPLEAEDALARGNFERAHALFTQLGAPKALIARLRLVERARSESRDASVLELEQALLEWRSIARPAVASCRPREVART